jgi:serine/threonine-protein kinase
MISEGDLVTDKYRIERLLGEGGMGHVYAATHEQLGIRVAIKILSPTLCQSDDAVRRFSREARASVRIQSEHVARVLDVGQTETGAPFMVMEFLSGHDLANELKQRGPLPTQEAVQYVLQASEAVAEAHALGVIHRDLKPANLFLTRRPDGTPLVKVLDFGIAKAIAPEQGAFEPAPSLTATHSFLGSPAYMSPEQVRTPKAVDTRSDIWSLGTILYELLLGELPFRGSNALDLLAAVASDPMPSIRQKRQDVSLELEAIIAKCLEKKPDDRFQSVASFAQALAPHAPPSSLPTVSRISGIQRATPVVAMAPGGSLSEGGTLRSTPAERPIGDSVSTHPSITPPAGEKHTITDFGRSQTARPRSRSRLVVAAGIFGLCVIAALVVMVSQGGSALRTPDERSAHPAARAVEPPSPVTDEPTSAAPPSVSPLGQTPSASPSAVSSVATPPKPTRKALPVVTRSPSPGAAPTAPAPPPAPAPAPATTSTDPLEGRR